MMIKKTLLFGFFVGCGKLHGVDFAQTSLAGDIWSLVWLVDLEKGGLPASS